MYVARASWPSANGKLYTSIYLRHSYRDRPQVRKRNIANLTHCPQQEIAAIELALKHKGNLAAKLALWQLLARVLEQGSRLSAVRLAQLHAACDVLGIRRGFDEHDLYEKLTWLSQCQGAIERRLFSARRSRQKPELFLYDVSSSYLEGRDNELAA